jgi:hypothetical protein
MTDGPIPRMLLPVLDRFAGQPILVLGDLMCDHYLLGEVGRISPEAPVPVVRVRSERHTAGRCGKWPATWLPSARNPCAFAVGDDVAGVADGHSRSRRGRGHTRPGARSSHNHKDPYHRPEPASGAGGSGNRGTAVRDRPVPADANPAPACALRGRGGGVGLRQGGVDRRCGLGRPARKWSTARARQTAVLVDPKPVNRDIYAGADLLSPNSRRRPSWRGCPAVSAWIS